MEKRFVAVEGSGRKVSGYACLWDAVSNIEGVGPECFAKNSLQPDKSGVSLYWMHDRKNLLGNTRSGTMKVIPDEKGLFVEATLPESRKDILESVKRKDCQGFSVGFVARDEDRSLGKRRITKADLFEVSLVDRPSHQGTDVKLRSKQHRQKRWTDLILEV